MIKNYIKTAFRLILRNRFISIINILGLGFGLAMFILIGFYVAHELNHDKFNENYENIYRLERTGDQDLASTPAMFGDLLCQEIPELESFNRFDEYREYTIKYDGIVMKLDRILMTDSSFFTMFSYDVIQGDKKNLISQPFTIVLTQSTANRMFGTQNPVGRIIKLDNKFDFTISGVIQDMPSQSHIKANALIAMDNLKKFRNDEDLFTYIGMWNYYTYFLLNDNANIDEVEEKIADVINSFIAEKSGEKRTSKYQLTSLKDIYFSTARNYSFESGNALQIKIFFAVGVIILALAIINFINLSIAHLYVRSKELGVRKVLGASKMKVVTQLLNESIIFAIIALNISLIFVELLKPVFNQLLAINIRIQYFRNPQIFLFILIGGIIVGTIAGIFPALHMSKLNPVIALQKEVSHGKSGIFIRKLLTLIQFFIATALVVCTLVVFLQLKYIQNLDLGFNKSQLVYMRLNRDLKKSQPAFKEALKNIVGVENVSYSYASYRLSSERWSNTHGDSIVACHIEFGDEDYLETLEIQLIEGRDFSENVEFDDGKFIVNETCARELYNNNAIGKELFGAEIVGVVKDYSFETLHHSIEPLGIYCKPQWTNMVNVRIEGMEWERTIKEIRKAWKEFSPNYPFEFHFVDDYLENKYRTEQQFSKVFMLFTFVSIVIACLGIIGLISFTIQRKSKEIGIRKVNGATTIKIVTILSSDQGKLIFWSILFAIPVSRFVMYKWLQNFAYHTQIPIWVYFVSGLIILLSTFIAIAYQSIKASRLNPVDVLRYE